MPATKILLSCFFLLFCSELRAQVFEWAKCFAGANVQTGQTIAADGSGNIFIAGTVKDSLVLDGTKIKGHGIYVAYYRAGGQIVWARVLAGAGSAAIAADSRGNCFITGYFADSIMAGSAKLLSQGGDDVFAAKMDSLGSIVWIYRAGSDKDDRGLNIAVDAGGFAYVAGIFRENAFFGSSLVTSQGGTDIFLARLDTAGQLSWVKKAGGAEDDEPAGIGVDVFGNTMLGGNLRGEAAFNAITTTYQGNTDAFVARYDVNGQMVWVRTLGGPEEDYLRSLGIDAGGRTYITGSFSGTARFGSKTLTTADRDIFVAKLLFKDGQTEWAVKAGGPGQSDEGLAMAVDAGSNAYVAGVYSRSCDFGGQSLDGGADEDIFVAKYTAAGNVTWAKRAGGSARDRATAVAHNNHLGALYLTGVVAGSAHFDRNELQANAGGDMFVGRLNLEQVGIKSTAVAELPVTIYPNPARSYVQLNWTSDDRSMPGRIGLYSGTGQQVLGEPMPTGATRASLNLETLPAGLYILEVIQGQSVYRGRVVVE